MPDSEPRKRRGVRAWVMWAAITGVILLVLLVIAVEIYRASNIEDHPDSAPAPAAPVTAVSVGGTSACAVRDDAGPGRAAPIGFTSIPELIEL